MAAKARPWRPPFRQGDLDGLCGIYAIVNAIRFLCRNATHTFCERLFDELVQTLAVGPGPSLANITWGVSTLGLFRKLARRGVAYVREHLDIDLQMRRLQRPLGGNVSVDGAWSGLMECVTDTQVAIVELGGRMDHWTVATAVTERALHLYDSTTLSFVRRTSCTLARDKTMVELFPSSVVLIGRSSSIRGR